MNQSLIKALYTFGNQGMPVYHTAILDGASALTIPLFTVVGTVLVRLLVGIRTVIQSGGAVTMKFQHSVGTTDMCAAAAVTGNDVGAIYTITGNATDAIQIADLGKPILGGIAGGLLATGKQGQGLLLGAGSISVVFSASLGVGACQYVLTYVPVTPTGSVVST